MSMSGDDVYGILNPKVKGLGKKMENIDILSENLIENGDFSNDMEGWRYTDNVSVEGVVATAHYYNNPRYISPIRSGRNKGDTYYASFMAKAKGTPLVSLSLGGVIGRNIVDDFGLSDDTFSRVSETRVSKDTSLNGAVFQINVYVFNNEEETFSFHSPIAINLTKTFGAGNEPSVEQMDIILSQFPNSWFDGKANLFSGKETINQISKLGVEKANKKQMDWIEPTLINGWRSVSGTTKVKYMRDEMGFVHVEGIATRDDTNTEPIFVLPKGYTPKGNVSFPSTIGNNALGNVLINISGEIIPRGSSAHYFYLSPISFKGEV